MYKKYLNKEKRIWIVTELFFPEETATAYIFTRIANHLSKKYKVSVICGPEFYDNQKRKFFDEFQVSKHIEIIRTKQLNLDKNSLFQRTVKLFIISLRMVFLMCRKISKGDTVILATNPAPLLLLISLIKHVKKFQLHILVHDVFPENSIPAKIFKSNKSFTYKVLKILYDNAYSGAEHLIVIGRDMKEIVSKKVNHFNKKPLISIVPNWSNPEKFISKRKELNAESIIVIQYAGNLGRVQGLIEILDAFRLSNNSKLCLNFRGTGASYTDIEKYIKRYDLKNVYVNGGFSRVEETKILTNCDIGLVSLSNGMYGLGVPSKTYQLLSAGKPILYIGEPNTEVSHLVLENSVGWSLDIRNKNELIDFFINLSSIERASLLKMGTKSRLLAETDYNETKILNLFQAKIESLLL